MKEFNLSRTNQADLRFFGEKIAEVSSYSATNNDRWTVLALYKTKGGDTVCHSIGRTKYINESDIFKASVCKNGSINEKVIRFFGQGWLAKELYEKASIDNAEIIS